MVEKNVILLVISFVCIIISLLLYNKLKIYKERILSSISMYKNATSSTNIQDNLSLSIFLWLPIFAFIDAIIFFIVFYWSSSIKFFWIYI